MTISFRRHLLTTSLLVGSVGLASPLVAQTTDTPVQTAAQPATPDNTAGAVGPEAADIIVTGSRIARPDLEASSPVAVITGDALKATNAVNVENLLQQNPQFGASSTRSSNNPGDGSATVELRELGSNRNLVLVDGKRLPAYDTSGAVDINTISPALIKRVDVLTGGASAVYGSDAISGVVNFILDDRFVGLRTDASSQITRYSDGATYNASVTGGVKLGDRGNFVISGDYSKRKGVKYGARPHNDTALDSSDLVSSGGSTNGVPTIFDLADSSQVQVQPDGTLSPDLQLYNFTPVNYAQLPFERYSAIALARYEVADGVELYGRGMYSHIKTMTTLAPTATAGFTFNLDPTNPFLTPDEVATFFGPGASIITPDTADPNDPTSRVGNSTVGIRRRIIETGGRVELHRTEQWQFVGGVRGTVGSSYKYDIFAQYAQVKKHEVLENDLSYTALQQALDVVQGPNGPQCFDANARAAGCVPLNVFTTGTIPQNQLAYVLRNALQDTKSTQFVAGANFGGDLTFLQSPFADAPAAFSIGAEYRREKATTSVDANYASGDLIYYGQGQNIAGKYNVKEAYAELKAPLVRDKPFIYALNVEGSFRYSHYSTAGTVYTYSGGGDYSPVEGVKFRGIYERAVRAPSIYELFSPVVAGTGSLSADPCAGPNVSPTSTIGQICLSQGAPSVGASATNPNGIAQPISGQINVFTGGNPNLQAEKADTYTVGLVVNPPRMRALTFSVDYFNINIANAIDTVPPFITINQCFNVDQNPTSASCSGIHRNTLTGSLSGNTQFGVPQQLGNVASIKTDGIDVSVGYRGGIKEDFNYALSFAGSWTRHYQKQSDPTAPVIECAGRFGSACNIEPIAKWKHVFDVNLGYRNFNLLSRWRYFGPVKQDVGTDILKSRIPSFTYIDEMLNVDINKQFSFRLGVQNLFDKKSPIVGDTVGNDYIAGSTFPNTYDVLGRTYFAGITANF